MNKKVGSVFERLGEAHRGLSGSKAAAAERRVGGGRVGESRRMDESDSQEVDGANGRRVGGMVGTQEKKLKSWRKVRVEGLGVS